MDPLGGLGNNISEDHNTNVSALGSRGLTGGEPTTERLQNSSQKGTGLRTLLFFWVVIVIMVIRV